MNTRIVSILSMIHKLEEELEVELAQSRVQFAYKVENGKVQFQEHVLIHHKKMRSRWLGYLLEARPAVILTAPLIYSMIIPFALLDLAVSVYQLMCFRIYGIITVKRGDYLVFDRGQLAYLNVFERFNCFFCSYGNGVLQYAREISARTEQYWCPIKHAKRVIGNHKRYNAFAEYGDAAAYMADREPLRAQLGRPPTVG